MQVVRIASLKPNKLFTEHSKKRANIYCILKFLPFKRRKEIVYITNRHLRPKILAKNKQPKSVAMESSKALTVFFKTMKRD